MNLKVRTLGQTQLKMQCPVHDDRTPSLSVKWEGGGSKGGFVMLWCHGCNAPAKDLTAALGLVETDLWDEPLPPRPATPLRPVSRRLAGQRRGKLGRLPKPIVVRAQEPEPPPHEWTEVERYAYTDAAGVIVQEVVRQECRSCTPAHKTFRQLFVLPDGRRVDRTPEGFARVLYRLPRVIETVAAGEPVALTEGEKDVHSAERHGLVATTNTQGATSFTAEHAEILAGATVHAVLDRDDAGWARGLKVYDLVTAVGGRVTLLLPATLESHSDLTDHYAAGYDTSDLIEVSRAEVATWAGLGETRKKAKLVRDALDEAEAHLEAVNSSDGDDTHQRHAQRWALESQIRFERVEDAANEVVAQAVEAGGGWVAQATEQLQRLLDELRTDLVRMHEQCGLPIPPALRDRESDAHPGSVLGEAGQATDAEAGDRLGSSSGNLTGSAVFRIVDNAIVQWQPARRSRDDADDEEEGSLKVVLGLAVRVIAREFLETEHADDAADESELMGRATTLDSELLNPPPPRQLSGFVVAYIDPASGEEVHSRVSAEQWKDHSWLDSLPGPPDYDHRKSGLDTIQRAVLAVSPEVRDTVRYRSTGWRPDGDTHLYVHARGVITAQGHRSAPTLLSGPLARYNLPDPIDDATELRRAFVDHSATLLDRLPARVGAPLLGQVFRSVLGPNPWVLTLVGPPGSYKTSVAAKAMHHLGERWDHTSPTSSMSGNGDTLNAMRLKLHNAKDTLYWMDDFAPTKRWVDAQKLLEEMTRLIHNREERNRSSRDGLSMTEGTGPRASGLATSEVMPRPGSGAERMLVVPLARDDIDTALLFPLDEPSSRYARAVLMASFIRWLAGDLTARRADYLARAAVQAEHLTAAGETVRQANALANTWVGWVAISDFLVAAGAITADEQALLVGHVEQALQDAGKAATDPDLPTRTGTRVQELLAYALYNGVAYVDDVRTGEAPSWPLARRLGWQRTITDVDQMTGTATRIRMDRVGERLGWVMHDPDDGSEAVLLCQPTALEPVLKAAAAKMADGMQIDRNTASRALLEEGILVPDLCEDGKTRFTKTRLIQSEHRKQRVTVLRLHALLGDDPDDNPHGLASSDAGGGPSASDTTGLGTAASSVEEPSHRTAPTVCELVFEGAVPARGPHAVDTASEVVLPSAAPPPGETSPMSHADNQPPAHESYAYRDHDGVEGWSARAEVLGPCVVCGRASRLMIGGHRAHPVCWAGSTAAQRTAAGGAEPAAAPNPQPTPDLTPAAPQSQPAVTTDTSPQPRPLAASRAPARPFRAAAVVVDGDQVVFGDGTTAALPFPLGHVGDVARLAETLNLGTQITKYRATGGQVWLTAATLERLGLDLSAALAVDASEREPAMRDATRHQPAITAARAAGWSLSGDNESMGRWTWVWRDDSSAAALIVALPLLNATDLPLIADEPDPKTLARRLQLFADAVGHPFKMSSSITGLDLMRALRWKDRERFFTPYTAVPPAANANTELDPSWCRKPNEAEARQRYVHAYDRSGSYLAGGSLEVGVGEAEHHPDGREFDAKLPGYWRIEIPPTNDWRMPHPLDPSGQWAGKVRWCTTPAVQFAVEQDYPVEVLEAYTWPEHARVMEPWYERMRDARTRLDVDDVDAQAARQQLKFVYAHTFGMMGSQQWMAGKPGYAPDRRHLVLGKARTNLLRRVARIGATTDRWPVAVVTDTIIYTSDEPDPVKAWPGDPDQLGNGLGQFKAEGTAPLSSQLQYLTGGLYKGRDALINWRADG